MATTERKPRRAMSPYRRGYYEALLTIPQLAEVLADRISVFLLPEVPIETLVAQKDLDYLSILHAYQKLPEEAVYYAAQYGYQDLVAWLLLRRSSPVHPESLLYNVVLSGSIPLFAWLRDVQGVVSLDQDFLSDLLELAVDRGHLPMTQFLMVEGGATLTNSALAGVAVSPANAELIEWILNYRRARRTAERGGALVPLVPQTSTRQAL